jgi:hypothetical protein
MHKFDSSLRPRAEDIGTLCLLLRLFCLVGLKDKAVSNAARIPHGPENAGVHGFTAEVDKTSAVWALALKALAQSRHSFPKAGSAAAAGNHDLFCHRRIMAAPI